MLPSEHSGMPMLISVDQATGLNHNKSANIAIFANLWNNIIRKTSAVLK
jgi:hypothetical protein